MNLSSLLQDLSQLEKLPPLQLAKLYQQLKQMPSVTGKAVQKWDSPAAMAEELSKGTREPWVSSNHLKYLSDTLVELTHLAEEGREENLLVSMPPQHGKLLSHNTLVPTAGGLKTHGELQVGDLVFGRDGKQYPIVAIGEDDLADVRVTFSDGASVVCHENHEWIVYDRSHGEERVVETTELLASKHDMDVASMPRKVHGVLGVRRRKAIVKVERVAPEPGRCIQTAAPDGVYLVTDNFIPTHNSYLCSYWFPLWLFHRDPAAYIILCSYSDDYARRWGRKIRDFIIDCGGELGLKLKSGTTAADEWELESGGGMKAAGTKGSVTGRGTSTALIIDDAVKDDEEAGSEIVRDRIWDFWMATANTRMNPGSFAVVVGTRWDMDDLIGRLERDSLSGEGSKFRIIKFAAEALPEDPLGRNVGEVLWPEKRPHEWLMRKKKGISPYWWNSLYQQTPTPLEGGTIKRDWWKFYEIPPAKFDEVIMSWDLAFKDLKKSDYTVGSVWGRKGAEFYLLDLIKDRMDAPNTMIAFRDLCYKWPQASMKLIEDAANGPAVAQMLRHEISGIVLWPPKGQKRSSKDERISAVSPFIQAGNVYIPRSAPWVADFIEELAAFPSGLNDDCVDVTSQALGYLRSGAKAALNRDWTEATVGQGAPKTTHEVVARQFNYFKDAALKRHEKRFNESLKINPQVLGRVPRRIRAW